MQKNHVIFKLILFWNRLASFQQISSGALKWRGIENLLKLPHSINQEAAMLMVKTLEILLQNQESFEAESWYIASGT